MDVSKNRRKPPKMDGGLKWKTLLKWMIWRVFPYFWKCPYENFGWNQLKRHNVFWFKGQHVIEYWQSVGLFPTKGSCFLFFFGMFITMRRVHNKHALTLSKTNSSPLKIGHGVVDDPVVLCLSSRNSIVFYKFLGPRKSRAAFFFYPSIEFGLLRQLTELHLEVRISRQLVPPHVAVHIG